MSRGLQELDLQNCTELRALPTEVAQVQLYECSLPQCFCSQASGMLSQGRPILQAYKLRYCVCGCTALPWHEAVKLTAVGQTGCLHKARHTLCS